MVRFMHLQELIRGIAPDSCSHLCGWMRGDGVRVALDDGEKVPGVEDVNAEPEDGQSEELGLSRAM
jgi:hypothetical protein